MIAQPKPHYLLFAQANQSGQYQNSDGRWHFLLESLVDDRLVEASDIEPDAEGERLQLLAVVRGLEELDQPSRVTLVTSSRYVSHGLRFGLEEWRANSWRWERFGRQVSIKNADLWQRIDRCLQIHKVECRRWRFDLPAASVERQPVPAPKLLQRRRGQQSRPATAVALCERFVGHTQKQYRKLADSLFRNVDTANA